MDRQQARFDRREAERDEARFSTVLMAGEDNFLVSVSDVSTTGLKAFGCSQIPHGTDIVFDLPGIGEWTARLMWRIDDSAGFSFVEPVPKAQTDAFLDACRNAAGQQNC